MYTNCISNGREASYVIGQTTVATTHHADDVKVYYAGMNSFIEAYPKRDWTPERLKMHQADLKFMARYLKVASDETKRMLEKAEKKA